MNGALGYLWLVLLKRRALSALAGLRRPTTLIGFAAVAFVFGYCFHYRRHEAFEQLVRRESLIGAALIMGCGSLFKGFLQRGLVFEPADIEFLFTSPFTRRQIVFYRLWPNYLFAVVQGLFFLALFASHLRHPVLTAACVVLFQIVCFHVSAGAAIFGGTISEPSHQRVRWMMLGTYALLTGVYLHSAWDLKIVPSFVASPLIQIFFYPALTWSEVAVAPGLREWGWQWLGTNPFPAHQLWQNLLYLGGFALAALLSLWLLLKFKADIFETSLATTARVAEKRLLTRQGRRGATASGGTSAASHSLPRLGLFRGIGAVIWKNLVVARRSRRELALAFIFTFIYTAFLVGLTRVYHNFLAQGGWTSTRDETDFHRGVICMLAALSFLLQWTFSFDFRRDGEHLVGFRTLPVSPFALALAEVTVPTAFCLAFQAAACALLLICVRLDWQTLLLTLLGFPAIALGLNGVWNLHYLLAAVKRARGKAQASSPVGMLMVVVLSFLIFYPAGWTMVTIGKHMGANDQAILAAAIAAGLAVQYSIDFLLVLLLSKLFQHFEVARDS